MSRRYQRYQFEEIAPLATDALHSVYLCSSHKFKIVQKISSLDDFDGFQTPLQISVEC